MLWLQPRVQRPGAGGDLAGRQGPRTGGVMTGHHGHQESPVSGQWERAAQEKPLQSQKTVCSQDTVPGSREKYASPGSRRKTINWGHVCPFLLHPARGLTFGTVLSLLCCPALQNGLPDGPRHGAPLGCILWCHQGRPLCSLHLMTWFPWQPTNSLVTGPGCSPNMSMCFSAWSVHFMCPHKGERTHRMTRL